MHAGLKLCSTPAGTAEQTASHVTGNPRGSQAAADALVSHAGRHLCNDIDPIGPQVDSADPLRTKTPQVDLSGKEKGIFSFPCRGVWLDTCSFVDGIHKYGVSHIV